MMYLLYGLGSSNRSIKKYFDLFKINYKVFIDDELMNINCEEILFNVDIIIKSPGILNDTKLLNYARFKKITIITDIELFYNLIKPNYVICVSGSNGKTTVTKLLEEVMQKEEFVISGNIGLPIFDYWNIKSKKYIIECSSYMLEHTISFKPNIYILLNLEKHHLDHHHTFVNYIKAKIKPLKNMTSEDYIIYPNNDLLIKRIVNTYDIQKIPFELDDSLINFNQINLIGIHNYLNVITVLKTLSIFKVNIEEKLPIIYNFQPLPHRLEMLKSNNNKFTLYINDSKSTNVYSTVVAVKSIKQKFPTKRINLLVGGKDINQNYKYLLEVIDYIHELYCFGSAGKRYMNNVTKKCNYFESTIDVFEYFKNMVLKEDDIILFSPGAPSLDEFSSFEERGNSFKTFLNLEKRQILF